MEQEISKSAPSVHLSTDPVTARKEVWLQAWVAVAACWNCRQPSVATNWADNCLNAFDKQFGK